MCAEQCSTERSGQVMYSSSIESHLLQLTGHCALRYTRLIWSVSCIQLRLYEHQNLPVVCAIMTCFVQSANEMPEPPWVFTAMNKQQTGP
jgi:hypothetical protein